MPTISMFNGIKVYMNWNDHSPPHFHASYSGCQVIIAINTIEILEGDFPNKQLNLLLEWAKKHKDELKQNWELAENNKSLNPIKGLE